MTLIRGIVIGFLACCALVLAGCSLIWSGGTRNLDAGISSKIEESLETSPDVQARQVHVKTREAVVYLTGVVDSADARREAGRIAWRTRGVDGVVNDLTAGQRMVGSLVDDVMISSRVKSMLMADIAVNVSDIDVSSTQGVVTLIGRVRSAALKQDAERIARGFNGVTGVHNELVVGKVTS